MKKSFKLYISILLITLVAGVWYGIFRDNHNKDKSYAALSNINATVLSKPRELVAFAYTDNNNHAFNNENLKGKWSFMFFGFTHCHSICPTTMAEMKTVFQQLPKSKYPSQMILVTVDPENDTPEQLTSYLNSFNPEFIGVTGHEEELEKLRQQLGILSMKNAGHDHHDMHENHDANPNHQDAFDHSGTIVLINPDGQYHAIFSMPHSANGIVADFNKIQSAYSNG